MRDPIGLLLLAATTTIACSDRTLTAERAADVIRELEQFKREAHFTLRTDTPLQTAFRCETGTGKTEAMLAILVSTVCERVLIPEIT